jgi:hypothetical protein
MNIKEVASDEGHRHRAFAERVLDDDLARLCCMLFQWRFLIQNRGGSVRPHIEYSERYARLEAWRQSICDKYEAAPSPALRAAPSHLSVVPEPVVEVLGTSAAAPLVIPEDGPVDEFGMGEDFFNALDAGSVPVSGFEDMFS